MPSCHSGITNAAIVTAGLAIIAAPTIPAHAQAPVTPPAIERPVQTPLGRRQVRSAQDHIATLHARLHITPAQEPLWRKLASAMQDSAETHEDLLERRQADRAAMNAVDDLKTYSRLQDADSESVQHLIAPFEHLYASFDAAQKKQADETFRKFTDQAADRAR